MSSVICKDETERPCDLSDYEISLMNSLAPFPLSSLLEHSAYKASHQLESAARRKKKDKSLRLKGGSELVISCYISQAEVSFSSWGKCFIKHTTHLCSVLQ